MNENNHINDGTTSSDRMIHTPSSFARKNLSFVQEIGELKSIRAHSSVRENMDSYLFFIVEEGSGIVNTSGYDFTVNTGDCVFLDCKKHYEHTSSDTDPWKIRWIHFTGKTIAAYFSIFQEANELSPVFTPENGTKAYTDIWSDIKGYISEKSVMDEIESSLLLEKLLLCCLKEVTKGKNLSMDDNRECLDEDEFTSLRESVNEHFEDDSIGRILSIQYGVKEDKLSEIFQNKYGISMQDYILNRKFNKAKELLRFTIKPIEEIIEESGIKDGDLFASLFSENEEMTPQDYRKKWGQWIKS